MAPRVAYGSTERLRITGIDVDLHPTFLILLAWVGAAHYMAHANVTEALGGVAFIVAQFGIIVLHELGHARSRATTWSRPLDGTAPRHPSPT
jgi:Zn-dependent protease